MLAKTLQPALCRGLVRVFSSDATRNLRLLVVDGYEDKSRVEFDSVGMQYASDLYIDLIKRNTPSDVAITFDKIFPCTTGHVPLSDEELASYDGVAWTGSSLSAYGEQPGVKVQEKLMQQTFQCGTPSFGSCWGLQMAAQALGGKVELNPKGREVGIGRKISLSEAGRTHPLFSGKKSVFECFESHGDEVTALPDGGVVLAGNDHTAVQAMAVTCNGTESWFVQYHPEYNLHYFASLIGTRKTRMKDLKMFNTDEEIDAYVAEYHALHADPDRTDIKWKYGIDEDLLDATIKEREVTNWVQHIADRR